MKVALYTRHFLESTHYAIAMLLSGCRSVQFSVFAKRFWENDITRLVEASVREECVFGTGNERKLAGIDIVHSIYDGDTAFEAGGAAQRCGVPFVLSFHGGFDTNAKLLDSRYSGRSVLLANSADLVTVVSQRDAELLRHLGVDTRVEILPVPVDLTALALVSIVPPHRRRGMIAVGRLIEKKGFETAIGALCQLPGETLTIIGAGPLRAKLEEAASRLGVAGRVRFMGELTLAETLHTIGAHRVLIHPSRRDEDGNSEGTPQVILWAYALRVPVVASDAGSTSEIVEHERTGILVPQNDRDAIALSVLRLLREPTFGETMADRACAFVEERHSLPLIVQRLEGFYRGLMGSERLNSCKRGSVNEHGPWVPVLWLGQVSNGDRQGIHVALAHALARMPYVARSVEFAGQGGQGILFACFGEGSDPVVAIKIPWTRDEVSSPSPCILREVRCLSELAPSGLAPKLLFFEESGAYLVRNFLLGSTLNGYVRLAPLRERLVVVDALVAYARTLFLRVHQHPEGPFVIRDLKPANLVFTQTGGAPRVLLADFGSVNSVATLHEKTPVVGRRGSGRWLHWPPEELFALGSERRGVHADYFSLGVTAFFMLARENPYSNAFSTQVDALRRYEAEYVAARKVLAGYVEAGLLDNGTSFFMQECLNPDAEARAVWVSALEESAAGTSESTGQ